jgi:hypothetical protein
MFIEVVHGKARDVPRLQKAWTATHKALGKVGDRWLGATAGTSDDGEFVAMLVFESEEGARVTIDRVADLPVWRDLSDALDLPGFDECPNVRAFASGNLEQAESVEISQGKAKEIRRLIASFETTNTAAKRGHSVLGGLWCWDAEGSASIAVYRASRGDERLAAAAAALERPSQIVLPRPWSVVTLAPADRDRPSKGGRRK